MSAPQAESPMHHFVATYVGELRIDSKYKVVIGIDLGTTYSGTAIVSRNDPKAVNCGAPGAQNTRDETKTPTVLLRCPDGSWLFGKNAEDAYKELVADCKDEILEGEFATEKLKSKGAALFRNYKMELKDKVSGASTIKAKSTMGESYSLMELMTKTLAFLSGYALQELKQGWMGALEVSQDEVLWVLTVPAIWNDFGKVFMRSAASKAGLIADESSDQLLLALEPESASIAVHAESKKHDLFKEGTSFLNLDIGGGTADFTMHKVASEKPLRLHEIAPPTGGDWGGIYVDEQFRLFLKRLIGYAKFKKLESYHSVEITDLRDEFRSAKILFDPDNDKATTEINLGGLFSDGVAEELEIPDLLTLVEDYNARDDTKARFDVSSERVKKRIRDLNKLFLPRDQMLELFEPTLKSICTCVRKLLQGNMDVEFLTVVGGYGSSKVLELRIKREFESAPFNKTVVNPNGSLRPQAAIVTGAAYFGLYTSVIGKRITKYTYGVGTSHAWKKGGKFPKKQAHWDARRNEYRVRNVFSSIVTQGVSVAPNERFDANTSFSPVYDDQTSVSFPVYQSKSDKPALITESGCELIGSVSIPCRFEDSISVSFTFGPDIRVEAIRQDGEVKSTRVRLD